MMAGGEVRKRRTAEEAGLALSAEEPAIEHRPVNGKVCGGTVALAAARSQVSLLDCCCRRRR